MGLIDRIKDNTDGDEVSMGELVEGLGRRAFGPLFIVVSLIAVLPTGAIPGMSVLIGTVMLLLSVQLLFSKDAIWLPGFVEKRAVPRDKLMASLDRVRGPAGTVDRYVGPRLTPLLNAPFIQLVAAFCVLMSLSMYPLAVVPFGAFPAAIALIVVGLGLMVRDGLLIAIGLAVGAVGLLLAWRFWPL